MATEDIPPNNQVILPSLETPTLTKAELSELLFDRLGLNKRESKDVGSSRVDLQACKLEYSIVSPK